MSQQGPTPSDEHDTPSGDPWQVLGYVIAGVAFYGFLGWLADQWLGTSFLVAIGLVVGAGLGVYMTYARFNRQ